LRAAAAFWQRTAFEMSAAKLSSSRLRIPLAIGLANNLIAWLMNVSANAVMSGGVATASNLPQMWNAW
jgi:hypothetical protein